MSKFDRAYGLIDAMYRNPVILQRMGTWSIDDLVHDVINRQDTPSNDLSDTDWWLAVIDLMNADAEEEERLDDIRQEDEDTRILAEEERRERRSAESEDDLAGTS